jgi:V/A-type H+-transporting ATPase subunit D
LAASPIATGSETLKAQQAFGQFAQALVDVANTETRLRRMGEEIKKTNRRVNALEQVVIPGIRTDMRFIQQALEEREHEDIFRLKRIKGKS